MSTVEVSMKKYLMIAAIALAFTTPAMAASDCSDKDMMDTKASVDAMPAGANKDAAMKELQMTMDAKTKKDMKSCQEHSTNTKAAAGKK